jgi:hypothetical protein
MKCIASVASVATLGLLAGCAVAPTAPSVLVMPGAQKSVAQFDTDNAACQQRAGAYVAPQVDAANTQAAGSAVVGTAIGAALGALMGSGYYYNNSAAAWGAGTGLMMGSAVGSSQSQAANFGLQQHYDQAYLQCMFQRGNQVPGQVVYRRAVPAVRPAPPSYPPPGYPAPSTPPPSIPPPNTPPPV